MEGGIIFSINVLAAIGWGYMGVTTQDPVCIAHFHYMNALERPTPYYSFGFKTWVCVALRLPWWWAGTLLRSGLQRHWHLVVRGSLHGLASLQSESPPRSLHIYDVRGPSIEYGLHGLQWCLRSPYFRWWCDWKKHNFLNNLDRKYRILTQIAH